MQGVQLLAVSKQGQGSSCLQWVHGGVQLLTVGTLGGPAAYSGYMG